MMSPSRHQSRRPPHKTDGNKPIPLQIAIVAVWLLGRIGGTFVALTAYLAGLFIQGQGGAASRWGPFMLGLSEDYSALDTAIRWWWLVPLAGLALAAAWAKNLPPGANPLNGSRLAWLERSLNRHRLPTPATVRRAR